MQQLEHTLRTATSLGGRQFWTKLESELDKLADPRTDLPPEKKAKILSQIKAISDRWRPFLHGSRRGHRGRSEQARPVMRLRRVPILKLAYATAPPKRTSESKRRWQLAQCGLWI